VEQEIVDLYTRDAELSKAVAKVCARCNADGYNVESRKMMGMPGSLCWRDLLEEGFNQAKRLRNPTVDFVRLSACAPRT